MVKNWYGRLNLETGPEMREVPRDKWPIMPGLESEPLNVWLSNEFMAVLYRQRVGGALRLCVNKTRRNGKDWRDGITWDELQRIKNETLGEDVWCIENYPAQSEVVNVSNMRHLYIVDEPPAQRFPKEAFVPDDELTAALAAIKRAVAR